MHQKNGVPFHYLRQSTFTCPMNRAPSMADMPQQENNKWQTRVRKTPCHRQHMTPFHGPLTAASTSELVLASNHLTLHCSWSRDCACLAVTISFVQRTANFRLALISHAETRLRQCWNLVSAPPTTTNLRFPGLAYRIPSSDSVVIPHPLSIVKTAPRPLCPATLPQMSLSPPVRGSPWQIQGTSSLFILLPES